MRFPWSRTEPAEAALAGLFDACLTAIERGDLTLESALAAHPAEAARLRPLLTAAIATRQALDVPGPSPALRARVRARVLEATAPRPAPLPVRPRWQPALAAGMAMLLLCAFAVPVSLANSDEAVPGDWNYGLKRAGERVRLATTLDDDDRRAVHLALARRRGRELEVVLQQNRTEYLPQAVRAVNQEVEALGQLVDETIPAAAAAEIAEVAKRQEAVLLQAAEQAPEPVRPAAQAAASNAGATRAAAAQVVSERGDPVRAAELVKSPTPLPPVQVRQAAPSPTPRPASTPAATPPPTPTPDPPEATATPTSGAATPTPPAQTPTLPPATTPTPTSVPAATPPPSPSPSPATAAPAGTPSGATTTATAPAALSPTTTSPPPSTTIAPSASPRPTAPVLTPPAVAAAAPPGTTQSTPAAAAAASAAPAATPAGSGVAAGTPTAVPSPNSRGSTTAPRPADLPTLPTATPTRPALATPTPTPPPAAFPPGAVPPTSLTPGQLSPAAPPSATAPAQPLALQPGPNVLVYVGPGPIPLTALLAPVRGLYTVATLLNPGGAEIIYTPGSTAAPLVFTNARIVLVMLRPAPVPPGLVLTSFR